MRRVLVGAAALITALLVLTGCTKSISGTAVKAGGAGVPRNNNSQERYPNLLKECEVLTTDILPRPSVPIRSTSRARSSARSAGGRRPTRPV